MDDNNLYDISLTSTTKRSVCQSPLPPPTSQVPLLPPPLSRNSSNNFSTTSLSLASPSSSIPKRVPSLPTLNETTNSSTLIKRPGDYYIQKINSSKSSLNFSPQQQQHHHHHQHQQLMMKQRMSTDSLTSAQSSISDDHSIISSQFDGVASTSSTAASTNTPDSRLNSMTSDSFKDSTVILDSNLDLLSTISQPNATATTTNQALQQPPPQPQPPLHKPNIKSSSASHIPTITPKIRRAHSISAMQTLTRTKSKFISSSEAKQRQKLRKKKYDENDNDDYDDEEILEEFLFNVPIIKNKAELYSLTAANSSKTSHENYGNGNGNGSNHGSANSSSVTILSRNDLVSDRDQYCTIKPCPLPGKLGSLTDLLASVGNRSTSHNDESIIEEEEEEEGEEEKEKEKEEEDRTEQGHQQDEVGLGIVNDDTTIISNISTYYNQQVEMKNKLARQNVMYKIPNFIKSNSSLEDLHLISLEKLSVIDSTRPSHLPPKSMDERKKHNQQIDKILHNKNNSSPHLIKSPTTRTSFNGSDSLSNNDVVVVYNQEFINLVEELQQATDSKTFSKKFQSQRDMIRTFAWTLNIPNDQCFQFLLKILSLNQSCQDSLNTIKNSFLLFETKFNNLPESIKSNKMMEFNKLCQEIMTKPLFKTIPFEEQVEFMEKLKLIWNIKAISESGLNQDEIFLISILLKVFPQKSCQDIYCLLELINQEVLTKEFKQKFNNNLLK